VDGSLTPTSHDVLTPELTEQLVYSILNDRQKKRFEMEFELDLSFGIKGLSRFRANVFLERGSVTMAVRAIPWEIRSFQELGLPSVMAELAGRPKGLLLVTGPTGSGKSTTLAAVVDKINRERQAHIITVEDPIEYVYRHNKCIVSQRQLESDTKSFPNALKYILRQDPDVVLIGEMRDLETIKSALVIAETGHLTLATLHTNSAAESINRIIDVFPPHEQSQVRTQVSFLLEGVVTQQLVPKSRGGRALALEIMVCTMAIRALIRDDKVHQIYSHLQAGQKYGMQTMNQSLADLVRSRQVSFEEAEKRSPNLDEFNRMLTERTPVTAKR
jgi:twitching motility protein PilT